MPSHSFCATPITSSTRLLSFSLVRVKNLCSYRPAVIAAFQIAMSWLTSVAPVHLTLETWALQRTFVNPAYIKENKLEKVAGFQLTTEHFHPFPFESAGTFLAENTYVMVYNKI